MAKKWPRLFIHAYTVASYVGSLDFWTSHFPFWLHHIKESKTEQMNPQRQRQHFGSRRSHFPFFFFNVGTNRRPFQFGCWQSNSWRHSRRPDGASESRGEHSVNVLTDCLYRPWLDGSARFSWRSLVSLFLFVPFSIYCWMRNSLLADVTGCSMDMLVTMIEEPMPHYSIEQVKTMERDQTIVRHNDLRLGWCHHSGMVRLVITLRLESIILFWNDCFSHSFPFFFCIIFFMASVGGVWIEHISTIPIFSSLSLAIWILQIWDTEGRKWSSNLIRSIFYQKAIHLLGVAMASPPFSVSSWCFNAFSNKIFFPNGYMNSIQFKMAIRSDFTTVHVALCCAQHWDVLSTSSLACNKRAKFQIEMRI